VAAHLPWSAEASVRPPRRQRLAECQLVSGVPLEALRAFYGDTLGLRTAISGNLLAVRAGSTRLVFRHDPSAGNPFYHFAFNIPENKIRLARDWQAERSPLVPVPERNRAAGFPPDVVDYSHWNAHSVFFLDPAGNVVEYIARHDLRNSSDGPFGPADVLHLSEIALVVDDVAGASALLKRRFALEAYRGSSDAFAALGDEHGLVLVMRRGRIIDFNQNSQEKAVRVFPTQLKLRSTVPGTQRIEGFPYEILSV
jgi:catechol-2,3-dioxygenase